MKSRAKIEFGDFQTPAALAKQVCELLKRKGIAPKFIVEPTCGVGAFLAAGAEVFPRTTLRGWDINPAYVQQAGAASRAVVVCQDFFTHDWEREFGNLPGELLILGNLPWVTNSTVSAMDGNNLPVKENFLGLRGLAARTGKANFDISEWMLIQLIRALRGRTATIAMLCKASTARKLLRYAWQNDGRIREASLYRIDAAEHFDAAVGACLLVAQTGSVGPTEADVYESLAATQPASRIGLAGQDLVADICTYRKLQHFEGLCSFQWRSGVKHDCASVMELKPAPNGAVENKMGERFMLESDCLYPLLKCSDLANGRTVPERLVLVTQQSVGADTSGIARSSPQTWNYLQSHRDKLNARKSSIYKSSVPFALFGIGDYAFAPWKVAVSGLHRTARFQVVGPFQNKPVFLDDTCYFLPFESKQEALLIADILNSPPCQQFIQALLFNDTKRPITVELLQRLNLNAIAREVGFERRWQTMQHVNYRFSTSIPQYELLMETARPEVRKRMAKSVSTSYTNPHHSRKKLRVKAVR